jgi:hypothetical protein
MECRVGLFGSAKTPVGAAYLVAEQPIDRGNQALDVDYRVAGEDLGQPLGEVAGQAAVWPLVEEQVKDQLVAPGLPVGQGDIVGTFRGIAEQGLKKFIGSTSWEKGGEFFLAEGTGKGVGGNSHVLFEQKW